MPVLKPHTLTKLVHDLPTCFKQPSYALQKQPILVCRQTKLPPRKNATIMGLRINISSATCHA